MRIKSINVAVLLGLLTPGCSSTPTPDRGPLDYGPEATTTRYTKAEASGLIGIRPYPNPDDVCLVIGENATTRELLDDSALLIGCPKHERGAIEDRKREGANIVAHAKHWTLLSAPN